MGFYPKHQTHYRYKPYIQNKSLCKLNKIVFIKIVPIYIVHEILYLTTNEQMSEVSLASIELLS